MDGRTSGQTCERSRRDTYGDVGTPLCGVRAALPASVHGGGLRTSLPGVRPGPQLPGDQERSRPPGAPPGRSWHLSSAFQGCVPWAKPPLPVRGGAPTPLGTQLGPARSPSARAYTPASEDSGGRKVQWLVDICIVIACCHSDASCITLNKILLLIGLSQSLCSMKPPAGG